ncbi:hypothetical protein [Crystallibacter crystallopoietes]|uniref:hypothetical protein n=1 Tax=Crystallibacter crystallopoietes TaxID=37928 RepID=UPI0002DC2903|nr:hypothetical protein [Arthrobacter crystallopoietes]
MTAGERAAEQARQATERAAKLRRQAEAAERTAKSWAAGADNRGVPLNRYAAELLTS